MKRFPTGAGALALLTILAVGPVAVGVSCIPNPDVSGLPPYDAGETAEDTGVFTSGEDSGLDGTIIAQDSGPGTDTGALDAAQPEGSINGVVIDYTQANGRGVVPGATVAVTYPSNPSLAAPPSVTSDANGLFTIPSVAAGVPLEIGVTKETDLTNAIAYSSSLLVATVDAAQALSVFPVIHEGCFQIAAVLDAGPQGVNLQNAMCPVSDDGPPSGAYAAITFGPTSFVDPQGIPWTGNIRVEMIPLAYPSNDGPPDLSWALGLPTGTTAATPAGLLGAVEYRVYTWDPGQTDDGELLSLSTSASASPVSIAVPVYTAPTATTPLAYSFDPTTGAWSSESATPGEVQMSVGGVQYEMVQVPHLTWWAVANGPTPSTCVTGTLQGATGNVFVRVAGGNYLGSAAAVTDTQGTFCVDVNAATDGGASQIEIYAGAIEGAVPYGVLSPYAVTSAGGGTCASGVGCEALGGIALSPILTCVSGVVGINGGPPDASPPSPLNAFETFDDVDYAASAGIHSTAYVGQVAVGAGGAVCALAVPNGSIVLSENPQPSEGCSNNSNPVEVPTGASAPVCSAGGCQDAGSFTIGCGE
jgi:hypothetical protein